MRAGWPRLAGALWLALCATLSQAADAWVFPTYRKPAQVDADCGRLLADLQRQREAIAAMAAEPARDVLAALDGVNRLVEDTLGPIWVLAALHPDKAVRDACDACDRAFQAAVGEFNQDPRLFALLGRLAPQDAIDSGFRRDQLDGFEDSGVGLPPAAQARVRAINEQLTALDQTFERRTREDTTRLAFTVAELDGVAKSLWQPVPRDARGRVLLGVDEAMSTALLQTARNPATRERMWRAVHGLGGEANLKTLAEMVALRRELARLFGFDSYADFALRRRMVPRAADAQAFLDSVQAAVREREQADLAVLRRAKAEHLHTAPDATVLNRWDLAFYTERARQAMFKVEQDAFRRSFASDKVMPFLFSLARQLFGVSFSPIAQVLWHPDARAYEVRDDATRALLGTLYVDLYPRDGKEGSGAYVATVRNASTSVGQRPTAVLVANVDRRGLTLEDLSATLLHEFGHALHVLLSQTRYAGQGGTNVKLDFAEAPSQMLEDWVYDPRVLRLYAEACPACKPVAADLLARADHARRFGEGIEFARQQLYASYDLALYGPAAGIDPMALWAAMEGATPLGHVPGSRLPAGFSHVAGGYAAGYYSYLWSLVLAADLRTAFAADRLDAETGARYRRTILENGGQVPPAELMQQFLGRPSDHRAFFKSLDPP